VNKVQLDAEVIVTQLGISKESFEQWKSACLQDSGTEFTNDDKKAQGSASSSAS
jgi:hypothetical protein